MTSFKSMTDVAYDVMSKKKQSMAFNMLWQDVANTINSLDDEAIAQFYTDLSLDGRFVSLEGNKWDLKERYKFEETYVSISELDTDDDDEEELDGELEEDEDGEIVKNEEEY